VGFPGFNRKWLVPPGLQISQPAKNLLHFSSTLGAVGSAGFPGGKLFKPFFFGKVSF